MKLLFNLDVIEGNKVRARPSDYLKSLPGEQQITEVDAHEASDGAGHETDAALRHHESHADTGEVLAHQRRQNDEQHEGE